MVKVDSGPGRLQANFLAEARTLGYIVYPGVPNITSVTQETDQNYGPFKTQFTKNLKKISDARITGDLPTSLPQWLVGLLVFWSFGLWWHLSFIESCCVRERI